MQRRRELAASPARSATETWQAIGQLVTATLDRSAHIAGTSVAIAIDRLAPAGIALVAAGYLDRQQLTLVASPLTLEIQTVSGQKAMDAIAEETGVVTGAATATAWRIHLPRPEGLGDLIDAVVADVAEATTDQPGVAETPPSSSGKSGDVVDLRRLKQGGGR